MMQEQVEKVRAETKAVQESIGRAEAILNGVGKGDQVEVRLSVMDEDGLYAERKRKKRREGADKRVWEILEKEVGNL